jgi:hypothetical protein
VWPVLNELEGWLAMAGNTDAPSNAEHSDQQRGLECTEPVVVGSGSAILIAG